MFIEHLLNVRPQTMCWEYRVEQDTGPGLSCGLTKETGMKSNHYLKTVMRYIKFYSIEEKHESESERSHSVVSDSAGPHGR